MKTHRVNLTHIRDRENKEKCLMTYKGHSLGTSRTPLLSAARKLLQLGLAKESDRIETWRDNILSLAAPVWAAAKLDEQDENGKPTFILHRNRLEERSYKLRHRLSD